MWANSGRGSERASRRRDWRQVACTRRRCRRRAQRPPSLTEGVHTLRKNVRNLLNASAAKRAVRRWRVSDRLEAVSAAAPMPARKTGPLRGGAHAHAAHGCGCSCLSAAAPAPASAASTPGVPAKCAQTRLAKLRQREWWPASAASASAASASASAASAFAASPTSTSAVDTSTNSAFTRRHRGFARRQGGLARPGGLARCLGTRCFGASRLDLLDLPRRELVPCVQMLLAQPTPLALWKSVPRGERDPAYLRHLLVGRVLRESGLPVLPHVGVDVEMPRHPAHPHCRIHFVSGCGGFFDPIEAGCLFCD